MKVKELILELEQQDPEKEVYIQQGEEFDYMLTYTVRASTITDMSSDKEDDLKDVVVIEYY